MKYIPISGRITHANAGTMNSRLANQNSGCQGWANGGPMVAFYSRWRRAIIGDIETLGKKLFIMVCLKIIFQWAHNF